MIQPLQDTIYHYVWATLKKQEEKWIYGEVWRFTIYLKYSRVTASCLEAGRIVDSKLRNLVIEFGIGYHHVGSLKLTQEFLKAR